MVFGIVVAVFYDLVVNIFQYQKHLGVSYRLISVCQHTLEIENGEVFVRRYRAGTVPDICVASAGGEFGNIVHQRSQHIAGKDVVAALEFLKHLII